ncbi:MAG: ATP-binding cassette domain-containing protein [Roseovarius sp.]
MTAPPGLCFSGRVLAGAVEILAPVELRVPAGQWTCLLGASGVGKSTLLQCFAGLGDGLVLDGTAGATDGRALAGRVAMMAQADLLMPWLSVRENVMLGARLRGVRGDKGRAVELLRRVGLEALAERRPSALSGGQRQRAALARTLYEDRPVVLLDEPFSALDVATRARMQELAAEVLRGRTVLHVTHDPAEAARLGERVFVLTDQGLSEVATDEGQPMPRPPDDGETLAVTGRLTRLLLDAA